MINHQDKLTAIDLGKYYYSRWVVKKVSMEIYGGEIVGLLGPNGAGKTTSFYMIVGLIDTDCGSVILNGEDITRFPIHWRARKGIGYLPQEPSVFRKLSVEDNIMAVLETRKKLSKTEQKKTLRLLLNEFNIHHIRLNLGVNLSGGERRRVEIARSLAIEPKFILLDEPFAGIDPIAITNVKKIITHLKNKGIGVLITDHNVRETLDICERAYIVDEGEIISSGTPREILSSTQVRKVYLGKKFTM